MDFSCTAHKRLNCPECIKELEKTEFGWTTKDFRMALADFLSDLQKRRISKPA
jgi:hypothetical protein